MDSANYHDATTCGNKNGATTFNLTTLDIVLNNKDIHQAVGGCAEAIFLVTWNPSMNEL
jgi:hypothetical protein